MGAILTPALKITRKTRITKLRELPVAGEILVKVGECVTPEQVIARAELAGDLIIVKASEQLGIEPVEVLSKLRVKVGDLIAQGQVLVEHVGLWGLLKSECLAPCAGILELIVPETGHLGIRTKPKAIELSAYLAGTVSKVIGQTAVAIETDAALVQGIFGIGGERIGELFVLAIEPGAAVQMEDLPQDLKGKIIVGGSHASLEVLNYAMSHGAVGFVTGSIDDQVLKAFLGYDIGIALTGNENISMSLILTEGFGQLALDQRTARLFRDLHGKQASLSGATQVRAGALRPEVIIYHSEDFVSEAAEGQGLRIGAKVKIIRYPYFGEIGEIVELPSAMQKIPTEALARVLKARLGSGEVVVVPRANVELY